MFTICLDLDSLPNQNEHQLYWASLVFLFQTVKQMHPPGQSIVAFRPNKDRSAEDDEIFKGNLQA